MIGSLGDVSKGKVQPTDLQVGPWPPSGLVIHDR
jgi:hypothetical protein